MVLVGTYIGALLLTLIAFIFVTVYVVTGKYYFPCGRVAICFILSGERKISLPTCPMGEKVVCMRRDYLLNGDSINGQ